MPLYMDRHDVSEAVTAEVVAQIHQEDLKIQHKYGCRGLTYWFDDTRKTAFCLIEAPDENAIVEMHQHAHGEVPHQIIEVDSTIVESFLGRIEDPEKAKNTQLNIINDPAFRTLMKTTLIAGSFNNFNPLMYSKQIQGIYNLIQETVLSFNGNMVQKGESGLLISFKLVTDAVNCALQIHQKFNKINKGKLEDFPLLKTGLHAGVPVNGRKFIFEETIKLAERINYISTADIVVSSDVKALYQSENRNNFLEGIQITALVPEEEIFISRLIEFVESEWKNANLKVDDFHSHLGYSKSQLYRKMMALTGKSPNTFLLHFRLQNSLQLLSKQKRNISEVAFDCGFNSPSYFSKCFRKKYKIMPSEFLNMPEN